MATNIVSTAMTKMGMIATTAFDNARKSVGLSNDEDMALYDKLRPEDFEALVQKFGADDVVQYIKTMESRLQKVK